jgi:hypothetical protein
MVNATLFWLDHDLNQKNVELTIGTVVQPLIARGRRAGSVLRRVTSDLAVRRVIGRCPAGDRAPFGSSGTVRVVKPVTPAGARAVRGSTVSAPAWQGCPANVWYPPRGTGTSGEI